ncbi:MAG: biotin/lipoate A/B protein ligase family protein, partial [Lentisphaeria bacterium]|jgi:lipoate-protein ligase A|nr:biotin/lipoate A/B protein ligase family protein [Lentisphaeria bacterium]
MTSRTHEIWDFWADGRHDPAFNMAADEALLETGPARGRPLLRFYAWDRLAVSIGYVQRRSAAPEGFAVVRRPTGGGVVYHDHDFTYTVVFPAGHWLTSLDRVASYDRVNQAVQAGLAALSCQADLADQDIPHTVDRLTMVCFQNPTKYDVLLDGVKIAGSAQRRTAQGILHQGSIHFGGPLPYPRPKLAQALLDGFAAVLGVTTAPFAPTAELLQDINHRRDHKFATSEWNARR